MSFHVNVDLTNPGQFFACCGLLELASRLARNATGRFDRGRFVVEGDCTREELFRQVSADVPAQLDMTDDASSPLALRHFGLRLDWWNDRASGGRDLKVWAGSMQCARIARSMFAAISDAATSGDDLFDYGAVVYDPSDRAKKVEPFYFDARRAPNAHSRDVGFSPNDLELTTTAFPAVEALCLVGLQRFRPRPFDRRMFEYTAWSVPLDVSVAPAVVAGVAPLAGGRAYQFENWFRTGQKKQKAFRPAVLNREGE